MPASGRSQDKARKLLSDVRLQRRKGVEMDFGIDNTICNFPKPPKSAVVDMEPPATRLHLFSLPLKLRYQLFSTHFLAIIMPDWSTDRMEWADLALHRF
jgi:hypothetical protein